MPTFVQIKENVKKVLRLLRIERLIMTPYHFIKTLAHKKKPHNQKKLYDLCCAFIGLPRQFVVPGHFFSPIPSEEDLTQRIQTMPSSETVHEVDGIDVSLEKQLTLWEALLPHLEHIPFSVEPCGDNRYYFANGSYEQGDGAILYAMLHHLRPKKIIEIGCGYSSLLTFDVVRNELRGETKITLIDPYPELAIALIGAERLASATLIGDKVQNVATDLFRELNAGDLLFIDSTHVAKAGSDVLHDYFTILPALKPGVIIHIHDIFWPFEYLPESFSGNFPAWNELYLLRALLTNNTAYEILFFNHYFGLMAKDKISETYPRFLENTGGSIWLKKC